MFLKNFAKFTGKHLCQSLFFNEVSDLGLQLFLHIQTLAQVFLCEICEIFKNTYFYRTPPVAASVHLALISELEVNFYGHIQKVGPETREFW